MTAAPSLRFRVAEWFDRYGPLSATLAWLAVGLFLTVSETWLYQEMWVGFLGLWLLYLAWGGIQAILFLIMIFQRHKSAGVLFVVMIAGFAVLLLGGGVLRGVGDKAAFMVLRPAYDRVVSDVASGKLAPPTSYYGDRRDGVRYKFSEGRRDLISFRWLVGIPDGGMAIVYDASDRAATITERGLQTPIALELGHLFGEKALYCVRFADPHYYRCGYD